MEAEPLIARKINFIHNQRLIFKVPVIQNVRASPTWIADLFFRETVFGLLKIEYTCVNMVK